MSNRGNQPTPELTLERQRRCYDLRLKNWTQDSIAKELGISQARVSQILTKIQKKYTESLHTKHAEIRNDHILRFEALKEQLYRAWDASDKDHDSIKIIDQIRKLDADIRKMQGADAPTRTINTDIDVSKLTDDELRTIINIKGQG